jgi:hypothetical protein
LEEKFLKSMPAACAALLMSPPASSRPRLSGRSTGEESRQMVEAVSAGQAAMRQRVPAALLAVLALQLALAAGIIWRLTFVFAGRRYFCLFDDAMISMTYARNLCAGYGLEWARVGAPVEGFSHPLWLAFMIPANLLPLPLHLRGLAMQALSAALLALDVLVVYRLSARHFTSALAGSWLPAVCLTAFYRPLLYWSVLGMESALQALLCLLAVWLALDITEGGRDRHLALFGVLAAACLLRMDMAILCVVIEAHVLLCSPHRFWRSWRRGLALFFLLIGAYAVFRLSYFHDWLPNTYYLKLQGIPLVPRLLRGRSIALPMLGGLAAPLGLALAGALARRRRPLVLALAIFAAYVLYAVYVGGDAFEGVARANRFVNFTVPLVFLAAGGALDRWRLLAHAAHARRRPEERRPRSAAGAELAGLTLVTLSLVLSSNGLAADRDAWRDYLVLDKPMFAKRYEKTLARVRRLEQLARPGALVATVWAGIPGFYSDFCLLDLLGYNDRVIARLPPAEKITRENFAGYEPGHAKWSYEETFKRRPDAFLSLWAVNRQETAAMMARQGYVQVDDFWLRCGSPFVDWPAAWARSGGRDLCAAQPARPTSVSNTPVRMIPPLLT